MNTGACRARMVVGCLCLLAAAGAVAPAAARADTGSGPASTATAGDERVLRGVTRLLHAHGRPPRLELVTPTGAYRLRGRRPAPNRRVAVAGEATVDGFRVDRIVSEEPVLEDALGVNRVAVILVNFADLTTEPWTPATVRSQLFTAEQSVKAFFLEESYGAFSIAGRDRPDGEVFGWYTLSGQARNCWDNVTTTWTSEAISRARADGLVAADYEHIAIVFPRVADCGFGGLAYMPGNRLWMNGTLNLGTVAHEFSHNLGMGHASSYSCREGETRVVLSGTCSQSEYGDPFDVMGAAYAPARHSHNLHRRRMGWLAAGHTHTVDRSGTYTLATPSAPTATGTPLLRVPRNAQEYYDLELRRPYGAFDAFGLTDPVVNGVSVRLDRRDIGDLWNYTRLLDMTPATTSFSDAALAPGQSFTDPSAGLTITTESVGTATATVRIEYATAPDIVDPSSPPNLRARTTVDGAVELAWDPSSDDRGIVEYRVRRDGALAGASTTTAFTDTDVVEGRSYQYEVVAWDAYGNRSAPALVSHRVVKPDVTPPTTPDGLTATAGQGEVVLGWNASTDDRSAVVYRVLRDGILHATTSGPGHRDAAVAPATTYVYAVEAVDESGNASQRSAPVTVTTPRDTAGGTGTGGTGTGDSGGGTAGSGTPAGGEVLGDSATGGADVTAPTVFLRSATVRYRALRALRPTIGLSEPATGTVELRHGKRVLARAPLGRAVTLRVSGRGVARLRARGVRRVVLRVVATDRAGNRTTAVRRLRLR